MTDRTGDALMLGLMLLLPLAALAARRLPLSQVAKMAGAWIAIFGVGLIMATAMLRGNLTLARVTQSLGLSNQTVIGSTVRIPMADDGHFWTKVSVNGVERSMLIDSGASVTTINPQTAAAAGISTADDLAGTMVETANGTVIARTGTAKALTVGPISAADIEVMVADNLGDTELIGMNFLSSLKSWRVEGREMVLEPETRR
ncbi:MAG: TIGR02281 family clan AA aspartic protease [Sphingomonas sp.]